MVWFFPPFYPCAIYTVSKAVTGIKTLELCLLPLKISRSHLFFFFFCVIKIRNLRARGRLCIAMSILATRIFSYSNSTHALQKKCRVKWRVKNLAGHRDVTVESSASMEQEV
jgi:hypothetical protein